MKKLAEVLDDKKVEVDDWCGRKWIKCRNGYVALDKIVAFCETHNNGLVVDAGVFSYVVCEGDHLTDGDNKEREK